MASYILAGAVGGLGQGMVENADAEHEYKLQEAEHAHESQLENMRLKNQRDLQGNRIRADDKRQSRRNEFDAMSQDVLIDAKTADAKAGYEASAAENKAQIQGREDVAWIKAYEASMSKGTLSGNGWTVKTAQEQVIDPNSPTGFRTVDIVTANRNGRTWRQVDDKMFDAGGGQTTPLRKFNTIDDERKVESSLFNGETSPETFKDLYGYLPVEYVTGQAMQGTNFAEWKQSNRKPIMTPPAETPVETPAEGGDKSPNAELLTQGGQLEELPPESFAPSERQQSDNLSQDVADAVIQGMGGRLAAEKKADPKRRFTLRSPFAPVEETGTQ